ncbi:hypothetical protein EV360DRAFT_70775 [Lentinula raphanica]|nr:hypothetical protein EV360DRAFT_70775 [Lentinula raphanica]
MHSRIIFAFYVAVAFLGAPSVVAIPLPADSSPARSKTQNSLFRDNPSKPLYTGLFAPNPNNPEEGDWVEITAGWDKRASAKHSTCISTVVCYFYTKVGSEEHVIIVPPRLSQSISESEERVTTSASPSLKSTQLERRAPPSDFSRQHTTQASLDLAYYKPFNLRGTFVFSEPRSNHHLDFIKNIKEFRQWSKSNFQEDFHDDKSFSLAALRYFSYRGRRHFSRNAGTETQGYQSLLSNQAGREADIRSSASKKSQHRAHGAEFTIDGESRNPGASQYPIAPVPNSPSRDTLNKPLYAELFAPSPNNPEEGVWVEITAEWDKRVSAKHSTCIDTIVCYFYTTVGTEEHVITVPPFSRNSESQEHVPTSAPQLSFAQAYYEPMNLRGKFVFSESTSNPHLDFIKNIKEFRLWSTRNFQEDFHDDKSFSLAALRYFSYQGLLSDSFHETTISWILDNLKAGTETPGYQKLLSERASRAHPSKKRKYHAQQNQSSTGAESVTGGEGGRPSSRNAGAGQYPPAPASSSSNRDTRLGGSDAENQHCTKGRMFGLPPETFILEYVKRYPNTRPEGLRLDESQNNPKKHLKEKLGRAGIKSGVG